MANIRREMIDLKNEHAAERQNWIYAVVAAGIVGFCLGGAFKALMIMAVVLG